MWCFCLYIKIQCNWEALKFFILSVIWRTEWASIPYEPCSSYINSRVNSRGKRKGNLVTETQHNHIEVHCFSICSRIKNSTNSRSQELTTEGTDDLVSSPFPDSIINQKTTDDLVSSPFPDSIINQKTTDDNTSLWFHLTKRDSSDRSKLVNFHDIPSKLP
jgi:hypothetical protein